jgi:hypothetical protein
MSWLKPAPQSNYNKGDCQVTQGMSETIPIHMITLKVLYNLFDFSQNKNSRQHTVSNNARL